MFSELLSELVPGAEHPEDLEMLVGVAATSQEMQDRVLELVGQVGGDWWAGSRDRIVSSHWSGHRAPGHHRGPARDQRQDEQRDGAVPALPGQVCQQDSQERPGGEYYYYYL